MSAFMLFNLEPLAKIQKDRAKIQSIVFGLKK